MQMLFLSLNLNKKQLISMLAYLVLNAYRYLMNKTKYTHSELMEIANKLFKKSEIALKSLENKQTYR